jgi:hypothetical protein
MILGIGEPKFKDSGIVVLLDNCIFTPSFADPDVIEEKSVINGYKDFTGKGSYASFDHVVHLFKYVDPVAKFNELVGYEHSTVDEYYPHRDKTVLGDGLGKCIKNSSSVAVPYYVYKAGLFYKENDPDLPCLHMIFKPHEYSDITKTVIS